MNTKIQEILSRRSRSTTFKFEFEDGGKAPKFSEFFYLRNMPWKIEFISDGFYLINGINFHKNSTFEWSCRAEFHAIVNGENYEKKSEKQTFVFNNTSLKCEINLKDSLPKTVPLGSSANIQNAQTSPFGVFSQPPSQNFVSSSFGSSTAYNFGGTFPSQNGTEVKIVPAKKTTIDLTIKVDIPKGGFYPDLKREAKLSLCRSNESGLISKFAELLKSEEYSDVSFTFKNDETKIKAHKLLLRVQSPGYFAELLSNNEDEYELEEGISPNAFQSVLHYFYKGEPFQGELLGVEECVNLLKAAEKFKIEPLKLFAGIVLGELCTCKNAVELYKLVKRMEIEVAQMFIGEFVEENIADILPFF